jgi:hypothetical protein
MPIAEDKALPMLLSTMAPGSSSCATSAKASDTMPVKGTERAMPTSIMASAMAQNGRSVLRPASAASDPIIRAEPKVSARRKPAARITLATKGLSARSPRLLASSSRPVLPGERPKASWKNSGKTSACPIKGMRMAMPAPKAIERKVRWRKAASGRKPAGRAAR